MSKIKQFFYLVKPFWSSSQAITAWVLLIITIALSLSTTWLNVLIAEWNGDFYNALQVLDSPKILNLLWHFILLIGVLILLVVCADYLRKKLLIKWRDWMTQSITEKWLASNGQHYHLRNQKLEPDNPDQRIAEDVNLLISQSLGLLISFLTSALAFISFSTILWNLSGALSFSLFSTEITIPGYMFFVCVLYVLCGVVLTHFIGRKLHPINIEKQKNEADYRSSLIRCKEYGDSIAGQHGEQCEQIKLKKTFDSVISNWNRLIGKERNLLFFVNGFSQISSLAPIFFALPKFISGAIKLGDLMQIRIAFMQLNSALSWFIFCYKDIAIWQATVTRLYNFTVLLDKPIESNIKPISLSDKTTLIVEQLSIKIDENRSPMFSLSCQLTAGEITMIKGKSGIGKSTLLKCLAGFWPYYTGSISRTNNFIWLPQKVFIGEGKLADLLAYPKSTTDYHKNELSDVLNLVGLAPLITDMNNIDNWQHRLSGGEQQRLLFARLILQKNELLLLDELTASLDIESAKKMIQLLREQLPNSTIVFISHQNELQTLADTIIDIDSCQGESE